LKDYFFACALISSASDNDDSDDDAHIREFIDAEVVTLRLFSACTTVRMHSALCERFTEGNGKWLWEEENKE